ncbi:DUF1294 domain-containing protein [Agrobacterium sp. lyk4-40-TYG-31]|uniref:DUF1294 domain-containing protein n=1 Tax=Agrobacterium sp. lyk4-40-TYG-31 TaxID=3040276 RepID=UPI00254B4FF4|nr:DUF1294 domain-containing protein [Agrobacterium sp. lyk4-40-TYG-31]
MMILGLLLGTYIAFNLFVFLVFWWDKEAARNGEWRVRESTLLWLAFLGGTAGAILAQRLLRHKTRKEPFRSILLSIAILHVGVALSLVIMPQWPERLFIAAEKAVQKSKP